MTSPRPLALVTGASAGIGATFARTLAAGNHDLILVARRRERLDQLAQELKRQFGVTAEVLAADLIDESGLRRVENRIAAAPELELLVNNAGFGTRGRFFENAVDSQDQMHRLHVLATMRLTHAALKVMIPRGRGGIINVSSLGAFLAGPGNTSYCATKAWMNSFTEGLYLELKRSGLPIKVQVLCPGFTYSEFHDTMGLSRKVIPKSWWMPPEPVVAASLNGLKRGKWLVIPGARYRFYHVVLSLTPRFIRHALAIHFGHRRERETKAFSAKA